jgi:predicted HicB family RNase H-like nuclease
MDVSMKAGRLRHGQRRDQPPEPSTQVTISLRVPAELKARLEERAAKNHRNLSQEAERALEHSFNPSEMLADALALLKTLDRMTEAAFHVREMARAVYGDRNGEIGHELMNVLTMVEILAATKQQLTIYDDDLEIFRESIRKLERDCKVIRKGNKQWHGDTSAAAVKRGKSG